MDITKLSIEALGYQMSILKLKESIKQEVKEV